MKKKLKSGGKVEEELSRRYYDPGLPGSYGGVDALKRVSGKKKKVENWLSFQDTYTLHKPVKHKFQRRRVIVSGIDAQWEADLIDVTNLKKANDGFVFLLTCIDVLSKFAWVVPLKNKTGSSVISAFKHIFEGGRKPSKLHTDKGKEFLNERFQKFLKREKVDFFVTQNQEIKASVAERFNRTLKTRLWRVFTQKESVRYVEVLQPIVKSYNATHHRSINRAPVTVSRRNQEEVWQSLYGPHRATTTTTTTTRRRNAKTLRVGDRVRLTKAGRTFKKGYLETFTREKFTICAVQQTSPTTYNVKDDAGEVLEGTFYKEELQRVDVV